MSAIPIRGRSRLRDVLHRALPLLLLIPAAYAVRPLFWTPLDYRLYDLFLSGWSGSPWQQVVVVGIDRATRDGDLPDPVHPLSRHVAQHAEVVRRLDAGGVRAIVLDLSLSEDEIAGTDSVLVKSVVASGKVCLIAYREEEKRQAPSGGQTSILRVRRPAASLLAASNGAFLADIELDQDGVLRSFAPDHDAARLGVETLPEHLANVRVARRTLISFPSDEFPLSTVSYGDVLRGEAAALGRVRGRIAFVGQVEDPLSDFVSVPTLQQLGGGQVARGLSGVAALAAITETLLQGSPLRNASWPAVLAWNAFWCILITTFLPRQRPWLGLLVLVLAMAAAVASVGVLQVRTGLVFPAGLLVGCLFFSGGYAVMASHVETARRLHIEEAEQRRVHREMEAARRTQEQLLPESLPNLPGWDLWAANLSSLEVSGDYYDVILTDEGRTCWIVIADVSGKGMPASLLMSNVHAALHSWILSGAADPGTIATDLGQFLNAHTAPEKFVTLFLAALTVQTGQMRYVSAGHDAPLLLTAAGVWRDLETSGPPLGIVPDFSYAGCECRLGPGDLLCLYTDGVTEALNAAEQMYGLDRLRTFVGSGGGQTAQELGETLLASVRDFVGDEPRSDDITLVVLKSICRAQL